MGKNELKKKPQTIWLLEWFSDVKKNYARKTVLRKKKREKNELKTKTSFHFVFSWGEK